MGDTVRGVVIVGAGSSDGERARMSVGSSDYLLISCIICPRRVESRAYLRQHLVEAHGCHMCNQCGRLYQSDLSRALCEMRCQL